MASQKQIEANRRNAQKCTGPRSAAGKKRSAMNALKSGIDAKSLITRDEEPERLQALSDEYYTRWLPSTPEQRTLVDTLVTSDWLLRRYHLIEAQLFEHCWPELSTLEPGCASAQALRQAGRGLDRVHRYRNSLQRNFQSALRELERLQAKEAEMEEQTAAANPLIEFVVSEPLENTLPTPPQPIEEPPTSPQIGFVPQITLPPAASALQPPSIGAAPARLNP